MKENEKLLKSLPLPILVINDQGKVVKANDKIGEVFLYDGIIGADIFTITGIKNQDLRDSITTGQKFELERNNRVFKISVSETDIDSGDLALIFIDKTSFESLKERYNSEKPFCMKVEVDNYDELVDPNGSEPNIALSTEIDKQVRAWFEKFRASCNKVSPQKYVIWAEQGALSQMIESNFDILDIVRGLETTMDFPATLSIGIGAGYVSIPESEATADAALDLAQGRGGDQAVIKRGLKTEYFGGKTQSVAKNNKGKSRIVGHALKQIIEQSDDVYVMGHKYSDMDSFGAALGIYRFCEECGTSTHIVLDEVAESLRTILDEAKENEYSVIPSEKALAEITDESLLIVVDVNRPSLVQNRELLEKADKIIVIDHHRRVDESIEPTILSYIESYASSTCELVTEILQFMLGKKVLRKFEAEALLAGIMVDTNSFAMKTGVRTFEAAAWLKRQSADTTEVKRFFQENVDTVKLKSIAILKAQVYGDIAISSLDKEYDDAQVLCAMVADELLTLKGVKASFVAGMNSQKTVVSARSLGDINVQVIMEKFGGGGHLSVAACQVDDSIDEIIWKILEILEVNK